MRPPNEELHRSLAAARQAREPRPVLDSGFMEPGSPLHESVRQHYLFAGLDQDRFDMLVAHMTPRNLAKGDILFHRGDPAGSFFLVDTGHMELSLISPSGEKKVLEVVGPGRTFAEAVAFMKEVKYPVTAEALSETRLCQIPNEPYRQVLYEEPDACMRLLGDICRHLHARVREIEHLTIENARDRLASYLLDHIVDISDGEDEATVRLDLPRHVIASRLSIKPETLSRLLRQLTDEGVLTIEDRVIYVRSLTRLRPYN